MVVGVSKIARDITARKRAEHVLRESEERFRLVANTAPVLIWMAGANKLCTFFNQGWLSFTGRSMEQELGEGWLSGVHPDDVQRCLGIYSASFDARAEFKMEYRLRRVDGEYRWIVDYGVPRFES
jgi:PAS domain S-box-containing protein